MLSNPTSEFKKKFSMSFVINNDITKSNGAWLNDTYNNKNSG